MKVTELLNITKGSRNGCLSRKESVVKYLFVWSPIEKFRSLSDQLTQPQTVKGALIPWASDSGSLNG